MNSVRRDPIDDAFRRRQRRIKLVSLAVIFLCAVSLYRSQCAGRPSPDMRPVIQSGQMIAEETLKLVGNKGEIVAVVMDSGPGKVQVKAFRRTIAKQPAVTLAAVETVGPAQLATGGIGLGLSAESFSQLIGKYRKATAMVLLVGPPALSDQDIDRLDPDMPKVVVFAPMGIGVRKLLEARVVQVAIVPRVAAPMAPGAATASATPLPQGGAAWYEAVTPESIQSRPLFEPPPMPMPKAKQS